MKETFEYELTDDEKTSFILKCKAEYDTENSYNTSYYFYDNTNWLKDFIDLDKLSPENEEEKKDFNDFITRVHDYMVHGNMWTELREIKDNKTVKKDAYKINIKAKKI